MAHILIEEFHLTMFVPHKLPEHEYRAIRRTLHRAACREKLRLAAANVIHRYPSLRKVRIVLSR